MKFVRLHLHRKDGDLRGFHVGQHRSRHVDQGPRRQIFQHENIPWAATFSELGSKSRSDSFRGSIGNERDFFLRVDAQAGGDGGVRARSEFGWVIKRKQMCGGFSHSCEKALWIRMRMV